MTLVTADTKVLIFEGPDGGGKSTLIKFLEATHGYKVLRFDKPKTQEEKDNMFKMYAELLLSDDILNGKKVILDRSWFSEMAYGPVMRDKSYISSSQSHALEALLVAVHGKVIYVTASYHTLLKRTQQRGEDYVTPDKLLEVCERYNSMFNIIKRTAEVIHYNNC